MLYCSYTAKALEHISNLIVQGGAFSSINSELNSREIGRWSRLTTSLPDFSFKFVRKAIQQQLATAANMVKWGRATSNLCSLCNQIQTNKHVLSNCSSPGLLSRYTKRHNEILAILVEHLSSILTSHSVFADLPEKPPVSTVFIC